MNCFRCCSSEEELNPSKQSLLGIQGTVCVRPFTISRIRSVKVSPKCQLYCDQTLRETENGLKIVTTHIVYNQLKSFIQNEFSSETVFKSIIDHSNVETNKVTQNFYITSFGGLKAKTIKANKINLLMNATIDLPVVDFPNDVHVETLRVPITIDEPKTLKLYLNDVADRIHENYLKNGNTLIYCHDGALNSIALALGYLIKYTDLWLSEALLHMQYTRKGFAISQGHLGAFEKQIHKFARKHGKNDVSVKSPSESKKRSK